VSNKNINIAKKWAMALGFSKESDNVWSMSLNTDIFKIDLKEEKIRYPKFIKIGRNTITNFEAEENFVVLNATINLVRQGYASENIEIEKGYRLGLNTKSGNADITVNDYDKKTFMIIECKTYGTEFDKAWKDTLKDGGQIFSYEKQENTSRVIILYAARLVDLEIEELYHAISLVDNDEFINTLENPQTYADAKGGDDKFNVWKDTYQYDYMVNGVLEKDIKPYSINKPKKRLDDLKDFSHSEVQKKYNEFASILRKHNIGGRENAFDKLVNLFLAKIVDEQQNSEDLQFVWKGTAQDTYYKLVDRLQKLYQIGMQKFLNETVTYVAEEDVKNAFRLRKSAAEDAILEYFKQLKYFSNSDFTFLEVYNEKLFFENSQVLVDIIKIFQDFKLKSTDDNQFLGDLFEGFLDDGVKQSEGQFFTPIPIVKFVISSLPLYDLINSSDIVKAIDYACGSGHFLNQYINQITELVSEDRLTEFKKNTYGIEKEYRLSKVSKVSAFMYGQDEINIIYGDALKTRDEIKSNSFSILIANPPYSVKGFLETLTESERKKFELYEYVNDIETFNNIELFFLELASKLLKSEGVVGIILPTPFLSNGGKIHIEARKFLLRNFYVVGIVEFGQRTFGKTGTNTVALFLRKRKYPPKESNHCKYVVDRWFSSTQVQNEDVELIKSYAHHIGVEYSDYEQLQNDEIYNLLNYEMFKLYIRDIEKNAGFKRIKKKKITKTYSEEDKKNELERYRVNYIKEIEKEKVYYYLLAVSQKNPVVLVKSPTTAMEEKKFLGYDWTTRRGQEGIQYLGVKISDDEMDVSKNQAMSFYTSPLLNPNDSQDETKINYVIRTAFNNEVPNIPEVLKDYVEISSLKNMIEFDFSSFDVQLRTIIPQKIVSKFPLKRLGEVVNVTIGGTPSRNIDTYFEGENPWVSISEMNSGIITDTVEKITDEAVKNSNVKLIPKGTTLVSFKLSIGKTAIAGVDLYTNEAIAGLIPKNDEITNEYLFSLFTSNAIDLQSVSAKAFGKSLNSEYLKNRVIIPVPPIDIQNKISEEFKKETEKMSEIVKMIEQRQDKISKIIESVSNKPSKIYTLGSDHFELQLGKRVVSHELTNKGIPVISANLYSPVGLIDKDLMKDFSNPSVLWSIDSDWDVRHINAGTPFYPTDHAGVIKVKNKNIDSRFLAVMLYKAGLDEKFTRTNRASTEKIEKIRLKFPELKIQNTVMDQVDALNAEIQSLKNDLNNIVNKRQKIILKYL